MKVDTYSTYLCKHDQKNLLQDRESSKLNQSDTQINQAK